MGPVRQRIAELLTKFVKAEVDQLCERVVDWDDMSQAVGSDESGHWVEHEIWVTYLVHPDVEPRRGIPNTRTYRWRQSFVDILRTLEQYEPN